MVKPFGKLEKQIPSVFLHPPKSGELRDMRGLSETNTRLLFLAHKHLLLCMSYMVHILATKKRILCSISTRR